MSGLDISFLRIWGQFTLSIITDETFGRVGFGVQQYEWFFVASAKVWDKGKLAQKHRLKY